jgi:hypothetical protein
MQFNLSSGVVTVMMFVSILLSAPTVVVPSSEPLAIT